ncbi:hypothetical protein J7481_26465, partial [Labrenzia sp. R4_2]
IVSDQYCIDEGGHLADQAPDDQWQATVRGWGFAPVVIKAPCRFLVPLEELIGPLMSRPQTIQSKIRVPLS